MDVDLLAALLTIAFYVNSRGIPERVEKVFDTFLRFQKRLLEAT